MIYILFYLGLPVRFVLSFIFLVLMAVFMLLATIVWGMVAPKNWSDPLRAWKEVADDLYLWTFEL